MTWVDTLITIGVCTFIILMIWSRVQKQRMIDTLNEIKEILRGGKGK